MPATKEQTDEHPIIFSGWSIRRILADKKTQTRRIVKPQPDHVLHEGKTAVVETPIEVVEDWHLVEKTHADNGSVFVDEIECPYGRPGDRLWVREAFRLPKTADDISPSEYLDQSGLTDYNTEADRKPHGNGPYPDFPGWGRKRPSIFMPRELCRLRLRVENVRVERVQEISAEDALNEGISDCEHQDTPPHDIRVDGQWCATPIDAFAALWDSIHGDGAWEENPFVWCVEFSRIE